MSMSGFCEVVTIQIMNVFKCDSMNGFMSWKIERSTVFNESKLSWIEHPSFNEWHCSYYHTNRKTFIVLSNT